MKLLSLEGLTQYTTMLLEKIRNMMSAYIPLSGSTEITGKLRSYDEIQSTAPNAFRLANPKYGTILRNDGDKTYFLLTNENDTYGSWNNLRPLSINNSTGVVQFENGLEGNLNGHASSATNADKLDGYHGDNYILNYSNYGAAYFNSTNLNDWTRPGCYAIQDSCTNTPSGKNDIWGTILVINGLNDRITQIASFWNETDSPLWYRNLNGSSWSLWKKVRDGGNAEKSNSISSTGFGDTSLTYWQGENFYDYNGWCHYLIANHGGGEHYYNYVIGLPFWDSPMYKRQEGTRENTSGWQKFYTTENITYGTSGLTAGSSNLSTGSIYLQYE